MDAESPLQALFMGSTDGRHDDIWIDRYQGIVSVCVYVDVYERCVKGACDDRRRRGTFDGRKLSVLL